MLAISFRCDVGPAHRLELPGTGPEAEQAFSRLIVIARSVSDEATVQSSRIALVCFAELVIGRRFDLCWHHGLQLIRSKINNVRLWSVLLLSRFEKVSVTHARSK